MQEPLSENLDSTPTPEEAVVSVPEGVVETASQEVVAPAPEETPAPKAEVTHRPKVGVRFPTSSKMFCYADGGLLLKTDEKVVVEGELGITIGTVAKAPFEPEEHEREPKTVLRRATAEDIRQNIENEAYCLEARAFCNERIAARGLPMKLLMAEVTLDRKRLLFYFISESRIDFRELVKDLASKYRTRIELRQIGVRDAAKMVGGIGVCGIEYCCRTFLKGFAPISIKMAKQQDLVLNTAKLSGGCGRLLCCLQYEYDEDALRAKRRSKNAPAPQTEEAPAQGEKSIQPSRPQRTRPPRPAPVEGAEPELTYHTDFDYEPQFTTPQTPDIVTPAPAAPAAGEHEDKQRRRRRRGRRKPGAEQGASQPQQGALQAAGQEASGVAGGGERRERPHEARPPRPQRPPMAQRPPRPEHGAERAQSAADSPGATEGVRPETGASTASDEAQRARRRRRWRNKPKGGPSQ